MTSLLHCPSCGRRALTVLQKLTLGPVRRVHCASCFQALSVPFTPALAAALPFLAAVALSGFVSPFYVTVLLWVVGFLAMVLLHLKWVPLVGRDERKA